MKKGLTSVCILFFAYTIHAQDIIVKRNGEEVPAQIIEQNTKYVKYKRFKHSDGPDYIEPSSEISMIESSDGSKYVFEKDSSTGEILIRFVPNDLALVKTAGDTALFTQNFKKDGDDMAAEGNYSGAARMYAECMKIDDECLFKLFKLIYDKKTALSYTDQLYLLIAPLAEKGNPAAEFYLGYMCMNDYGAAKRDDKAFEWFYKSAEHGYADAQYSLGEMYLDGHGVAADEAKAVVWYRKSAEQGNADAQCRLGDMYLFGIAGIEDNDEAVKWYRKSAEQGNARGQYSLGYMYETGRGVAKDKVEAVKWFRKSADQGYQEAVDQLKALNKFDE
jgi:hypothetical protein